MANKMTDEEKKYQKGHRQRLLTKSIENKLAEYENLELLLTYSIPRQDVKPLAYTLIGEFGGVREVINAPFEKLVSIKGVGRRTAGLIQLNHRLFMIEHRETLKDAPIFSDPKRLSRYLLDKLSGKIVEEFHVMYLDENYMLISEENNCTGASNWAAIYANEIVRHALNLQAKFVVLMHNHPTTGLSFSDDDIAATEKVEIGLNGVDIQLYDHFLVSGPLIYSIRQMRLLKEKKKS